MFLRDRIVKRVLFRRFVSSGLVLILMGQPIMAEVHLTNDQQRQYVQFVTKLIGQSTGEHKKASLASLAVGQLPCMQTKENVVGSNEWQELQVDSLIKAIDKTKTSFGHHVLRQTIQPTADMKRIAMRKEHVKALLDDQTLFDTMGNELDRIAKAEDALLAYWDDAQRENQGALFYRAKDFYFALLAHKWLLGDDVNNNKRYLALLSLFNMGKLGFDLFFYLGLQGVLEDFVAFMWGIGNSDRGGGVKVWDPWKSFKAGLQRPYRSFSPWLTPEGERYGPGTATSDTFMYLMRYGSAGDLFKILKINYEDKSAVALGPIGRGIHKVARCCGCNKVTDTVDAEGRFHREQRVEMPRESCTGSLFQNSVALAGTSAITYYRAVGMYEMLKTTISKAKNSIVSMKELHTHTIHMARALDAMKKLANVITGHEVLRNSCAAEHMHEVVEHPSSDLKKLFDLLKESTFTLKKAQSHIYSRGNVLLAHRLCDQVKNELMPLFQAVGELDAAYSMALFVKEHADGDTPCTFAEFVPGSEATIALEQAWLPMVKKPVTNTIQLGGMHHPNKIIITGPNGGGKSVFLKTIGCCVLLAQSWGIVPARRAQISLFDGVRSCIHPQESLEHELSTFMAEKMRIDAITQYVFENNKPGFKALLLLDEPFKGTVDAESADRIYAFGKQIASLNGLVVTIATHVEKPIHLAPDTGAYENYHVCIQERPDGTFSRSFTLEPGVLTWWFNDPEKRSRFIDFVTMEKHKEDAQSAAQA